MLTLGPAIVWDKTLGCMVEADYCGMPISKDTAKAMRKLLNKHLRKSSADLAGMYNSLLSAHPEWSSQLKPVLPKDMD